MRNRLLLATFLVAVFAGSFLGQEALDRGQHDVAPPDDVRRIVSMAPSITETLYAVGLGDRVVGVTRFCQYPAEVHSLPKVGGFHDPNFEAIAALRPDLVVMLTGDEPARAALAKLGIATLVVCHNDVDGILDSFVAIGAVGGQGETGRRLADDLRARLQEIQRKTAAAPRPKVLFVIQRGGGPGKLEDVYVAGSDGFYDRAISLAGGQNAFPPGAVRFPVVSAEGILWMDPDVIVDLTAGITAEQPDDASPLDAWQQVGQVAAVRNGRVYAVDSDYAFVQGPRSVRLVEDLARLLHPEIDWP